MASIITRMACGGIAILLMARSVVVGPGVPSNLGGAGGLARSNSATLARNAASSSSKSLIISFLSRCLHISQHHAQLVELGRGDTDLGQCSGEGLLRRFQPLLGGFALARTLAS